MLGYGNLLTAEEKEREDRDLAGLTWQYKHIVSGRVNVRAIQSENIGIGVSDSSLHKRRGAPDQLGRLQT
jgi:hypothetical protein